jgi:hypothetical protein
MSGGMSFWATSVKPGKPVKVNIEDGHTLRLTQVEPPRKPRCCPVLAPRLHRIQCASSVSATLGSWDSRLTRAPSGASVLGCCDYWATISACAAAIPRLCRG